MKRQNRRSFFKTFIAGTAGLAVLPNIMPRSLFAADAPSRRINVVLIGCGREGTEDVKGTMAHPLVRVVGVCDLDKKRLAAAQRMISNHYEKKGESEASVSTFHDYHDVLARSEIDAVIVSGPGRRRARGAGAAAGAGGRRGGRGPRADS